MRKMKSSILLVSLLLPSLMSFTTYDYNLRSNLNDTQVMELNSYSNQISIKGGIIAFNDIDENLVKQNISLTKEKNASLYLENSESQIIANVRSVDIGKYYFYVKPNLMAEGIILGTQYTDTDNLKLMVEEIKADIENGNLKNQFLKSSAENMSSLEISGDWSFNHSYKYNWSLDYENVHYGNYSEWHNSYEVSSNSYIYHLFAHETYVSPNRNNTDDFRTAHIKYHFDPKSDKLTLRDYAPKTRNPEATIGWSSSIGSEIGDDGVSVNASVSSSYSVIENSPKIHDYGNMANDIAEIDFEYLNPWDESDPWYSYNIEQSMQTSSYIFKENKYDKSGATVLDQRTITMVRDDLWAWNDRTVNFTYDINIRMN